MLPSGTVTFFFSDIEGSTRLLQKLDQRYADVLEAHRSILRSGVAAEGGSEVDSTGDAFFAAFPRASAAVHAAVSIQNRLNSHDWPEGVTVRVRMGLHTGEPALTSTGYTGMDVHRAARICAAAHGGQVLLSDTTRELIQDELPPAAHLRDLGEHVLKDLNRPLRLTQLVIDGIPSEFPALRTLSNRANNLPVQPTPLVGREGDVRAVIQLLTRPEVRLVTLTGPGGTGKTRLSLQAAADLVDEFGDGVYFVPLAFISDAALVLPAIARVLGLRDIPAVPLAEAVREYLSNRRVLLLLDNFEQVAAAAPVVAELLGATHGVKILVTSRTVLHLSGEHEYPVPPLGLPDPGGVRDVEALSQYASVELFIQRATAVRPNFSVTEANAPAVAEICYRLDGLPLAIELAAARSKLFSPSELLSRLSKPFELLTGGPRDLPDRHQTLQRAIEWSYDLLDPPEQVLFRTLSIFAGGCRLEAAEAVCGAKSVHIDVVEGIAALIDKSLLRRGEGPHEDTRFVMLETIRDFGLDALRASNEEESVRKAHADYFMAFAEKAEPHLTGPDQIRWLDLIEKEHENYRLALSWARARGRREIGMRIGASIWRFWVVRGLIGEGRRQLERLRDMGSPATYHPAWTKLLNALATVTQMMGDFSSARDILRDILEETMERGDRPGMASTLNNLSWVLFELGDLTPARGLAERARSLCHELGDRRGETAAMTNLAMISAARSEFPEALALMQECRRIREEIGEKRGVGYALGMTASVLQGMGEYDEAQRLIEQSLALADEVRDKQGPAYLYSNLGHLDLERGRIDDAEANLRKAMPLWNETGNKFGIAFATGGEGLIALARGDLDRARSLIQDSLQIFRQTRQKHNVAMMLVNLGHVERARKDFRAAAAAYEHARTTLEELGDRRRLADCLLGLSAARRSEEDAEEGGRLYRQAQALLDELGIRPTPWQKALGLIEEEESAGLSRP